MTNQAQRIEQYFDRLWPLNRSITGPGFRQSLEILSEIAPFKNLEFATGRKVLDWTIPQEWRVKEAYLICPDNKKRADFKVNNLHLVGYSRPFAGSLSLSELKEHLYSLPDQPRAIPYVTSYYKDYWGFCLSDEELKSLPQGVYQAVVDTELTDGELVVGETVLRGESKKEILFSSYLCHPSMANNELSGPLVLAFLYEQLSKLPQRKFTYRFVLAPETIGAIAFLSERGKHLKKNLAAGYQLTCLGDKGKFTYKKSRQENSLADRAALQILKELDGHNIVSFNPAFGSDERQYCSPGFNLPFGSLMRTMYAQYPEYHTSLDNKSLMDFGRMEQTVEVLISIIRAIEGNQTFINRQPYGEPQLGPRGLFRSLSTKEPQKEEDLAIWWLLNMSDGSHDLLSIAEKSGQKIDALISASQRLEQADLLKKS
ncbi:MAG TPA: DUF4910 domain-containing protein [Patescibacteria group bacterium]|nr:DUF4910 domain-containing protein [Patescibacteria group bacterium]